jgi:hypothetical protein
MFGSINIRPCDEVKVVVSSANGSHGFSAAPWHCCRRHCFVLRAGGIELLRINRLGAQLGRAVIRGSILGLSDRPETGLSLLR